MMQLPLVLVYPAFSKGIIAPLRSRVFRRGAIFVCKEYSIFFNGIPVGTASVRENGLYYRIEAACRPDNNRMLRLKAYCADKVIDLGFLVPEDDLFILCKDIPQKRMNDKYIRFYFNNDTIK